MKLLDTSVAIDHLRGAQPAVDALEQFFSVLAWVPVSENISRAAGELAQTHRRAYSEIDDADYLIAATTLLLDADLMTTNVRHFPMLAGLRPAY
ncbi:MAG: type II toxin-antitoxin system VapC family toxin [Actinobacteria bacterium]|jgi:hypothetical protein|nr:type II toxin-antitoxin system VapC family toxin [Actinomycetota bacterium]